jgi:hypothetical protein
VVALACDASNRRLRKEELEFIASIGYIVRPFPPKERKKEGRMGEKGRGGEGREEKGKRKSGALF